MLDEFAALRQALGEPVDTATAISTMKVSSPRSIRRSSGTVSTWVWKGMGVSENATMTQEVDISGALLDLVAATDYLSTTHRLGLTVWEAVEEALRWWTTDRVTSPGELPDSDFADLPWPDDPDPLRPQSAACSPPPAPPTAPTAWRSA